MPALVPELVNMASDPAVATADLLRRSLVIAQRLAVPELAEWATLELNGYGIDAVVPEYRILGGRPQALNPIRGYQPMDFPTAEMTEMLSIVNMRQPIAELEMLAQGKSGVRVSYPVDIAHRLRSGMRIPLEPSVALSVTQMLGIVEKVRNQILKFALDLEGKGVLGEGMTFTPKEKQIVHENHVHFSNITGSPLIQVGTNGSTQMQNHTAGVSLDELVSLVDALAKIVESAAGAGENLEELRAELATLKAQASSPKPKWEIIKSTARTIKNIAEGSTGAILATLATSHMTTLIALGS